MKREPTKILLVDDHEVVRRGVRALLEAEEGFQICGETGDGRTATELARALQPHVVVMDIGMPGLNGFEATRQILAAARHAEVLILSMHESDQLLIEVLSAGARGYVSKADAGRDLVVAVRSLSAHRPFFSKAVAARAEEFGVRRDGGKMKAGNGLLTAREREVLQLLAEGQLNKEVSGALGISVKTVETHRARIMRKLRCNSVADLVRYAIRNGVTVA